MAIAGRLHEHPGVRHRARGGDRGARRRAGARVHRPRLRAALATANGVTLEVAASRSGEWQRRGWPRTWPAYLRRRFLAPRSLPTFHPPRVGPYVGARLTLGAELRTLCRSGLQS